MKQTLGFHYKKVTLDDLQANPLKLLADTGAACPGDHALDVGDASGKMGVFRIKKAAGTRRQG